MRRQPMVTSDSYLRVKVDFGLDTRLGTTAMRSRGGLGLAEEGA
jgi:hypothetical protein